MNVKIHIRSSKMTESQYIPMIIPESDLKSTIEKYESYGYSVTIINEKGE